jgi:hypothetical protein
MEEDRRTDHVHGFNQETAKQTTYLVGLVFKLSIQSGSTHRYTDDIAYTYD